MKRSTSSRLRPKQVSFEIISTNSFHLRSAQDNLNTIFDPLIVLPLLKCLLGNFFQFAGVLLIWFINKKLWSFETSCLTLSSISNHTCCEPTCYFFSWPCWSDHFFNSFSVTANVQKICNQYLKRMFMISSRDAD